MANANRVTVFDEYQLFQKDVDCAEDIAENTLTL
jgi:hypothetical protein